jgi:hypothetical protein
MREFLSPPTGRLNISIREKSILWPEDQIWKQA